ncbi:[Fe-Fe] hydrogenase large subunit C-terminal domain-containing protein [Psychrilyobacter atlanticus]|uniref:[Fe-Fe] hydrogenase large subunit C-terminal domain-containing protein n=1 Tax=Psychrilyobacter atlanticus TaxID=271091 RepID=UPI0004030541|nr:[Fe-Fe] hydrogenase large subunit C-terminal domain-containing protein [Psychrilyobacter atlanticus]
MKIMNFSEANCSNCYKCVRTCRVKAIKIEDDQAHIVSDHCIVCGHCFSSCPQNARNIHSDLDYVKKILRSEEKVNISIAPSFRGFYEKSNEFIWGLKKLGFNLIEETAVGADITSKLYEKYISTSDQGIYITTCCPSVVLLIEKYYPALIPYLMPFTSPMISHGYLLKKENPKEKTVFLGPCIAKKCESLSEKHIGAIDAVLTFDEVSQWLKDEGIDYQNQESIEVDKFGSNFGSSYPVVGGILEGIRESIEEKGMTQLRVDGLDECIELFDELSRGTITGTCVEVSVCKQSCLGGPGGSNACSTTFSRVQTLKKYLNENDKKAEKNKHICEIDFSATFHNKKFEEKMPTEEEIIEILGTLEKYSKEDELNCGGCGYDTCRQKAISIYRGMSHKEMCIHYMKKCADKVTNEIFENSPNAILILNNEYEIIESNMAFSRYFGISPKEVKKRSIEEFISREKLDKVSSEGENIIWKKQSFLNGELYMRMSIISMNSKEGILIVLTDITSDELRKEEIRGLKEKTFEITQTVVEKQMRIAQEIASLLGETTAESKVAFNKLKDVFNKEESL